MAVTPIWPIEGITLNSAGDAVEGSLGYRVMRMFDDLYKPVKVYPTLAGGAPLVSSGVAWALGVVAQIVPASTILTPFLVHTVTVETLTAVDTEGIYELVLYQGGADTEVARLRFSVFGGFYGMGVFKMPSALVPASARIRGALAFSNAAAGAATATVSIAYREVT